jgi:hypothetical protein
MKNLGMSPRVGLLALVIFALLLGNFPIAVHADVSSPPSGLFFREAKVTGDEFVVVQNTSEVDIALNEYWLGYNSSDTATNIVPTVQLPATSLAPGEVLLMSNGATDVCDATFVADLGVSSLSDTKGTLVLRHLENNGATSSFTTVDSITWGKLVGDNLQIANEAKLITGSNPVWYKDLSVTASIWSLGDFHDCTLQIAIFSNAPAPMQQVVEWEQDAGSPPSIIVTEAVVASTASSTTGPYIPASDIGLKAVQLSEILPNPASPQTDADDEFIELYNPNSAAFDLSGFQLQYVSSGSATTHSYTFPNGTTIAPFSFKAFLPADTHLSLSNSGGQVWFVDPLGKTITQSDSYGTAKDGQAWVFASGKWQWTTQSTPNTTNKITTPTGSSTTNTATSNGKKVTAVKGASTVASKTPMTNASSAQNVAQVTPIHPLTLVVVVLLGLLYGAYEYRTDIANRIYQYRRYRATRRINRS